MKRVILILSLFALIFPFSTMAEVTTGSIVPDFTAIDSQGKSHTLSDFRGKTVVLEWTNSKCPYVRKHYDSKNMQQLQEKYTEKGVVWLTVNSSASGKQGYVTGEEANALVKKEGAQQTAYLLDPEGSIGKLYGARTTPHMYIIDPEGKLAYSGAIDSNNSSRISTIAGATNYVSTTLDNLLQDKEIQVSSTEPYGCSVKYAG